MFKNKMEGEGRKSDSENVKRAVTLKTLNEHLQSFEQPILLVSNSKITFETLECMNNLLPKYFYYTLSTHTCVFGFNNCLFRLLPLTDPALRSYRKTLRDNNVRLTHPQLTWLAW